MTFRIEYDRVVRFDAYRSYEPWSNGWVRIATIDGVNGFGEKGQAAADVTARLIGHLHDRLISDAVRAGLKAHSNNHCGFEVVGHGGSRMYLRFSDWFLYVFVRAPEVNDDGTTTTT